MTAGSAGPAVPRLRAAICCRGLTKRFGSVLALDGLDLDVPDRQRLRLPRSQRSRQDDDTAAPERPGTAHLGLGHRGAACRSGTGNAALARSTGYLDQDPRFHGWMTGREVLEFVGRLYGLTGPELRSRVAEALATAGLEDAAARRVGGYSGGMRQRLGLAQAVLARPQVLFLDEPVSSLDPEGRRDVLEIIAGLRGTTTVFMSTHILNDVERVCDRVGILDRGRLVTEAPIDRPAGALRAAGLPARPRARPGGGRRGPGAHAPRAGLGPRCARRARVRARARGRPGGGGPGVAAAARGVRGAVCRVRAGAAVAWRTSSCGWSGRARGADGGRGDVPGAGRST